MYSEFTGLKEVKYYNNTMLPLGVIGGLVAAEDLNKDGWISFMEDFNFANTSVPQHMKGLQNPVAYNGLDFDPPFVLRPQSPTANFTYRPQIPWINETTLFNASSSFSPNGNITSYTWNFGDDNVTSITEPVINHTYTRVGNYTVTLNVTDNFGMWNSSSTQITITYKTDINKDKSVNILDITIVATAFNSNGPDVPNPGDPPAENWNATADLNNDKWVNIIDITMVAVDFGKTT
jgi:PKD repeat protein